MEVTHFGFVIFLYVLFPTTSTAQCTERGRFPNQLEECRGYTMCISGATGFMEYNLTCPDTFIYSHIEQLCTNVTTYKCLPHYNCTGVGNFESDSNEDCRAFITCIEGIKGLVTARQVECPRGTIFNLNKTSCVDATLFKCPQFKHSNNHSVQVDNSQISGNFSSNVGNSLNSKYVFLFSFALSWHRINIQ